MIGDLYALATLILNMLKTSNRCRVIKRAQRASIRRSMIVNVAAVNAHRRTKEASIEPHHRLKARHSQIQQPVRPSLTGKHWNESVPGKSCTGNGLCFLYVRASHTGNLHVMELKALLDTEACATFTYG
ncbi:hypothetical protein DPMN_039501 [Dreissena polymorpha]|uniref:Uncharacterized protein n=1 Tax=Dreissena polymorpha TaxID=45954 RepID=A0A9D4CV36_DREPO|nr:hypothetical protein DPMN_039501 [Dreissena polymorpha]